MKDKAAEYFTLTLFIMIGLVGLAITGAITYRIVLWIVGI